MYHMKVKDIIDYKSRQDIFCNWEKTKLKVPLHFKFQNIVKLDNNQFFFIGQTSKSMIIYKLYEKQVLLLHEQKGFTIQQASYTQGLNRFILIIGGYQVFDQKSQSKLHKTLNQSQNSMHLKVTYFDTMRNEFKDDNRFGKLNKQRLDCGTAVTGVKNNLLYVFGGIKKIITKPEEVKSNNEFTYEKQNLNNPNKSFEMLQFKHDSQIFQIDSVIHLKDQHFILFGQEFKLNDKKQMALYNQVKFFEEEQNHQWILSDLCDTLYLKGSQPKILEKCKSNHNYQDIQVIGDTYVLSNEYGVFIYEFKNIFQLRTFYRCGTEMITSLK
ncbi:UNKNOWN [Stylonychia lemnae]|uniref:Kelch motif family protein n=1 Tax=Stylonychia lemnae TaxID=5949 RepID=A0A078AU80_STYLE|nr:UNKNOWN [Stylonychia lemnae]|eukprot:CDW85546.1 UNKNOWN [Stylonychia lemnae]